MMMMITTSVTIILPKNAVAIYINDFNNNDNKVNNVTE